MNRKLYVYLGLSLVSGGSFLVDRLFFGEPERAAAEPVASVVEHKEVRLPQGHPVPVTVSTDPSLDWLSHLTTKSTARDLFSPTPDMLAHYQMLQSDATPAAGTDQTPGAGTAEAFLTNYELQATFIGPYKHLAVINGRIRRLGSIIDGFTMTRVEPRRAEFRRGSDRLELEISDPFQIENKQDAAR